MSRSCHTLDDGGARGSLENPTKVDERERGAALDEVLDLDLLSEAELEDEVRAHREARRDVAEQTRDRIESFRAAEQRHLGLVAHFRLQPAAVAIADVRR